MQFRDLVGYLPDVGGFVTLAAMRSRRKVGAVGLDEDAIQRHGLHDVAEHRGVLKRNDSRKRQIETKIQRVFGQPGIT